MQDCIVCHRNNDNIVFYHNGTTPVSLCVDCWDPNKDWVHVKGASFWDAVQSLPVKTANPPNLCYCGIDIGKIHMIPVKTAESITTVCMDFCDECWKCVKSRTTFPLALAEEACKVLPDRHSCFFCGQVDFYEGDYKVFEVGAKHFGVACKKCQHLSPTELESQKSFIVRPFNNECHCCNNKAAPKCFVCNVGPPIYNIYYPAIHNGIWGKPTSVMLHTCKKCIKNNLGFCGVDTLEFSIKNNVYYIRDYVSKKTFLTRRADSLWTVGIFKKALGKK